MLTSVSKPLRLLFLYDRLCAGHVIDKKEISQWFGVNARSVQRDIDELRAYLAERAAREGGQYDIVYDRRRKGFVLDGIQSPLMSNSEILAVSKILLESRAFPKAEMSLLLDKLISGCVPQENMKLVSDLLANEKYHYVELTHPAAIQEHLWELAEGIKQHRLLELSYLRQGSEEAVSRVVEPAAILFSEYYFYLNAYIVEKNDAGSYVRKYDYPTVFRIDRILSLQTQKERFHTEYSGRFQEGEFRKRIQFMYPGQLQQLRFRYTGSSVEAILDRLPTARIRETGPDGFLIEAEVYGKGILMWLLSQGSSVEVLSPQELRREIRQTLLDMLERYGAPD